MKAFVTLLAVCVSLIGHGQDYRKDMVRIGIGSEYKLNFQSDYRLTNYRNTITIESGKEYDSVSYHVVKFEGLIAQRKDTLFLIPKNKIGIIFPILHKDGLPDTLGYSLVHFKEYYLPYYVVNGLEIKGNDTITIDMNSDYRVFGLMRPNYPHNQIVKINKVIIRINNKTRIVEGPNLRSYAKEINDAGFFEILLFEIQINKKNIENVVVDAVVIPKIGN